MVSVPPEFLPQINVIAKPSVERVGLTRTGISVCWLRGPSPVNLLRSIDRHNIWWRQTTCIAMSHKPFPCSGLVKGSLLRQTKSDGLGNLGFIHFPTEVSPPPPPPPPPHSF